MSLYLPDTGYVQGMAALAATLLCYYEEDRAFVMLVRLWMLRGLERLYETGFAGLMEALDDFEHNWLCGGDVAKKLVSRDLDFDLTYIRIGHPDRGTCSLTRSARPNWALPQPHMAQDGT